MCSAHVTRLKHSRGGRAVTVWSFNTYHNIANGSHLCTCAGFSSTSGITALNLATSFAFFSAFFFLPLTEL